MDHNCDTQFLPYIVKLLRSDTTGYALRPLAKPIRLIRLHVTALAIVKIGELLDGTGTIVIDGLFAESDALEQFWQE